VPRVRPRNRSLESARWRIFDGKYGREETVPETSRAATDRRFADRYLRDENFDVLDHVKMVALDIDVTPAQVSLAWLLHRDAITAPIIGARTVDQFEESLEATDVTLTAEQLAELHEGMETLTASNECLDIATEAAREVGNLQRRAFRTRQRVSYKSPDDIVTDVDTRAETIVTKRITDAFPDHAISGKRVSTGRLHIDGLSIRSTGRRISHRVSDTLHLHRPRDRRIARTRSRVSHARGRPVHGGPEPRRLLQRRENLSFDRRSLRPGHRRDRLLAEGRRARRRFGDANRADARARRTRHMGIIRERARDVVAGAFDGMYGTRFQPWDVAAGIVLIEEAGGTVTQLRGTEHDGSYAVSNGHIHDDLLECLEMTGRPTSFVDRYRF